ncbi:hypothetical protein ACHHYP_14212 [Achlya hypogyna]|uniref:Tc1-like transposase DDE domain-containing protein n=1 Tax=Achlya hypogyna TaxID=1202772 RepID=A0A1V9YDM6_ACHHY|nr:hypothetical protein ACHHYP_14212 [Achlya hypogyna]
MTYSLDLRWRAVVLHYVYGCEIGLIAVVLGMAERSIRRWHEQFQSTGNVERPKPNKKGVAWEPRFFAFVEEYAKKHPCLYIEELQAALRAKFPTLSNLSTPTICRALRFNLTLSRKVLEKRARESSAREIMMYYKRLKPFYMSPSQLVFVDETSKDGRDALRRYAWSTRGTPAIVELPFSRSQRVSVLATMDYNGFFAWEQTEGTFDRAKFHDAMMAKIIPFLNPYPLPRSI